MIAINVLFYIGLLLFASFCFVAFVQSKTYPLGITECLDLNTDKNNKNKKSNNDEVKNENSLTKRIFIILGAQFGDEGKGKLVDYILSMIKKVTGKADFSSSPGAAKTTLKYMKMNNETRELEQISFDVSIDPNFKNSDHRAACARFNGGSNAGHTIVDEHGKKYATHLLPSGSVTPGVANVIGNGVLINLRALFGEIHDLHSQGVTDVAERLLISEHAHVTLRIHCAMDGSDNSSIGTTKQGIGPTTIDKASRKGIRMHDLLKDDYKKKISELYARYANRYTSDDQIKEFNAMLNEDIGMVENNREFFESVICNTGSFLHTHLKNKNTYLLIEGANAAMLDPENGTWPFVTTTPCTIGGVLLGLSLNMQHLKPEETEIIGIVKGYMTRVGSGTHPTELTDNIGDILQTVGGEIGVTTKRKRRCGWLCLKTLKYSNDLNGYNYFNLTKLDIMSSLPSEQKIKVCVGYLRKNDQSLIENMPVDEDDLSNADPIWEEVDGWSGFDMSTCKTYDDLHPNIKKYIKLIESHTGVNVKYIGTGAGREAIIIQ